MARFHLGIVRSTLLRRYRNQLLAASRVLEGVQVLDVLDVG